MPIKKSQKVYLGIDIGAEGALVFMRGDVVLTYKMPMLGKTIDMTQLHSLFLEYKPDHVMFEDLHALFNSSAASTFTLGHSSGVIEAACHFSKIAYTKVKAKDWQKVMFEGVKEIRKPSKQNKKGVVVKGGLETKKMALIAAQRLFPNVSLLASKRSSVPHNGIVDALLIAEYCRRRHK